MPTRRWAKVSLLPKTLGKLRCGCAGGKSKSDAAISACVPDGRHEFLTNLQRLRSDKPVQSLRSRGELIRLCMLAAGQQYKFA